MNTKLPILLPASAFLLLAVYGAGIFPWTVTAATVAICLALRPWRVFKKTVDCRLLTADRQHPTHDTRRTTPDKPQLRRNWATCSPLAPRARLLPLMRPAFRSPFALLLLYLLVMLMPLPAGLPMTGGGERARQNRIVVETLDAVTAAGVEHGVTPVFSLTRSRAGSLRFLLLAVLAYAGWSLAANAGTKARTAALRAVLIVGSVMALAGVLGKWVIPQGDTLWWWIPIPHGRPGPMGGFMNRNHFAGFCAILAPAALALAAQDAVQRRPLAALLNATTAAMLAAGVLFSLSRGGMVALAAGLGVLLLIGLLHGRLRTRIALTAAVLVLGAAVLAVAWKQEAIRERLSSLRDPLATQSVQDRTAAWRDALRIWRQYPLLGTGPNAFRVVYPQHRTTSARDARDFAENEYVQWLCETGLAGLLLALLVAARLLRDAHRALRDGSPDTRALTAAAIAALAAAAVHALADFPLHLPLYALTVAALAGMLAGRETEGIQRPMPNAQQPTPNAQGEIPNLIVGCWALGVGCSDPLKTGIASQARRPPSPFILQPSHLPALVCLVIALVLTVFDLELDMDGRITRAGFPDTARALAAAPTAPVAWRRLAALLWQTGTPPARTLAERCLTQAAAYDPNNYPLWQRLGDMRRELGDNRGAMEAYRRVKALRSWVNVPTSLPEEN